MSDWVCGWDVGGAHLKWALQDPEGRLHEVRQVACPLWRGVGELDRALREAASGWPLAPSAVRHAATMTGELVDAFPDRASGVRAIVAAVQASLPDTHWQWFTLDGGWAGPASAMAHPARLASANWLATATCAAAATDGLLVDIGSTTTDIVALAGGRPRPLADSDGGRLASGELVYRGIVRTPVMALATDVHWRGARRRLMAEHFATTADLFRLAGELEEDADVYPSADSAEKTATGSARRLARMVGEDLAAATLEQWAELSQALLDGLLAELLLAAEAVRSDAPAMREPKLVCAGVGHRFAAELALGLGWPAVEFGEAIGLGGVAGVEARAPAVAVARLASVAPTPQNADP